MHVILSEERSDESRDLYAKDTFAILRLRSSDASLRSG